MPPCIRQRRMYPRGRGSRRPCRCACGRVIPTASGPMVSVVSCPVAAAQVWGAGGEVAVVVVVVVVEVVVVAGAGVGGAVGVAEAGRLDAPGPLLLTARTRTV